MDAAAMRAALELAPHPEGGAYRETWRDAPHDGSRGVASAILFLLARGERSAWHRVDADEIWLWQGGGSLVLRIAAADGARARVVLGPDVAAGEVLQAVVPRGCWQDAALAGPDPTGPAPVDASVADTGAAASEVAGADPAGADPAGADPAGADWVLVGCVVAPAFGFAGFEMAPAGWSPGSNGPT